MWKSSFLSVLSFLSISICGFTPCDTMWLTSNSTVWHLQNISCGVYLQEHISLVRFVGQSCWYAYLRRPSCFTQDQTCQIMQWVIIHLITPTHTPPPPHTYLKWLIFRWVCFLLCHRRLPCWVSGSLGCLGHDSKKQTKLFWSNINCVANMFALQAWCLHFETCWLHHGNVLCYSDVEISRIG